MKYPLGLLLLSSLLVQAGIAQQAPGHFTINGSSKTPAVTCVYLSYVNSQGKRITDSSLVNAGTFTFSGTIAEPTTAWLQTAATDRNGVTLFLEPVAMQLAINSQDVKTATLTGSPSQEEWKLMESGKESIRKEMEPLSDRYTAANNLLIAARKNQEPEAVQDSLKYRAAAIHDAFEPYMQRMQQSDFRFFAAHPTSAITAYYLRFYVSGMQADTLQQWYTRLGKATQQTSYGKHLAEELAAKKAASPGSMASNFSTKDMNGQLLQLSTFKGSYVLLDFWASWCIPCRKGNPHLKQLYAQYHSKGLHIIGVSDDDRDTSAWKKAVAKDDLPWHHVLRGFKMDMKTGIPDKSHDISSLFGIHTLPTKILIDRNGKIIGRYGSDGEDDAALDAKLHSLF